MLHLRLLALRLPELHGRQRDRRRELQVLRDADGLRHADAHDGRVDLGRVLGAHLVRRAPLLLEGFRVIPLIHIPETYGVSPRVKGGPGISPSGEWRFDSLWLEGARP